MGLKKSVFLSFLMIKPSVSPISLPERDWI